MRKAVNHVTHGETVRVEWSGTIVSEIMYIN